MNGMQILYQANQALGELIGCFAHDPEARKRLIARGKAAGQTFGPVLIAHVVTAAQAFLANDDAQIGMAIDALVAHVEQQAWFRGA